MMGSIPLRIADKAERARTLGLLEVTRARYLDGPTAWSLGVDALDAILPDAGLPRGSVIEIASPNGLGRATHLGLLACASAQNDSRWCAWIDPSSTLYAPGVVRAGVDLQRVLIVRPEPNELGRIAVRVTASGAFAVVVVDRAGVPGASLTSRAKTRCAIRWAIVVRRLALAAEKAGTSVILLSSLVASRDQVLPVAMRLELTRPAPDRLGVRITKDRRGPSGPHELFFSQRAQRIFLFSDQNKLCALCEK